MFKLCQALLQERDGNGSKKLEQLEYYLGDNTQNVLDQKDGEAGTNLLFDAARSCNDISIFQYLLQK